MIVRAYNTAKLWIFRISCVVGRFTAFLAYFFYRCYSFA